MKAPTMFAIAGATLALVTAPALGETVHDRSFDREVEAIGEELQRHEESGVFGREGDVPAEEGLPANAVRDRDFDRYVERLGLELRMRNAIEAREPGTL